MSLETYSPRPTLALADESHASAFSERRRGDPGVRDALLQRDGWYGSGDAQFLWLEPTLVA